MELKCPHCNAVKPKLNCRGLMFPNGIAAAIFSCLSCNRIISLSVIPKSELNNSAIERPTAKEVETLS